MGKNRFLVFIFSLIPGCGHMYMGYMIKGIQIMAMFATPIAFVIFFQSFYNSNFLVVIPILLLPIIWFYQFFDSLHSANNMRKLGIETPEDDGFIYFGKIIQLIKDRSNKFNGIIAGSLIFIGVTWLLSIFTNYAYSELNNVIVQNIIHALQAYLIPTILASVFIGLGIRILIGSKKKEGDKDA